MSVLYVLGKRAKDSQFMQNIEFFELDKNILDKALNILVKRGSAQIFKGTDEDSMGVKFFGAQ